MKFYHNEIDKKVLMVANMDGVIACFVNGMFETQDENIIEALKKRGYEYEESQDAISPVNVEEVKKGRKKK